MSEQKKPPLLKWWDAARGNADDLTYYKKSREMFRVVMWASVAVGILITTVKAAGFLFIYAASLSVLTIPAIDKPFFLNGNDALLRLWRELIPMLGVLLATGVFVFVVEKKSVSVSITKNPVRSITFGFRLGLLGLSVSLLCLVLTGTIDFGDKNNVSYQWVWLVSVLLNEVTQEYLVRGYLFSLFKNAFNTAVSVVITTMLFMALRGSALETGIVAVLNVMTISVLASLLLLYTESLLAPIIVRFFWNGIGGVVLGLVSPGSDYPSVWNSVTSGNTFISGGSAKLDGSIIVLVINILMIAFMCLKIKRRKSL